MNEKYGREIPDKSYIETVIKKLQEKIDTAKSDYGMCYREDGMKDIVLNLLDDWGIDPDDIDNVFRALEF